MLRMVSSHILWPLLGVFTKIWKVFLLDSMNNLSANNAYVKHIFIYPCNYPKLCLFQNSMIFPWVTDPKFNDFFHFYKFQELYMRFNDSSMILKHIWFSVIFQELWEPCLHPWLEYSGRNMSIPWLLMPSNDFLRRQVLTRHDIDKWLWDKVVPVFTRNSFAFLQIFVLRNDKTMKIRSHIDSLVHDYSIPSANALEILLSCTKSSIYTFPQIHSEQQRLTIWKFFSLSLSHLPTESKITIVQAI